jgi:Transmembrane protein 43
MTDTFTETTTKSWGSRIGDSIKGVLFGLVLIVGSGVFLFWNEGRAVQTQRSLTEGAGLVVDVDPARVDPANDGKLIHVSGELKALTPLTDAEFAVTAAGIRLVRDVEMYQWKEEKKTETKKNVGGSEETVTTYSYVHVWSDSRIDSSDFRQPDGHGNPQMRYRGTTIVANDATLGAFKPGRNVLDRISANDKVTLDPSLPTTLRGKISGPVQLNDGRLYLGESPANPKLGDLRVSYRLAPNGPASIVGRQAGTDFVEYQTAAGDRLLLVSSGTHSAEEMFKDAQSANRIMTWLLRLAGVVAMYIGFVLILSPLVVVADVVPFIGNILSGGASLVSLVATAVVAPIIIAIAWLWYRPLVSIAVLVVGLAVAYGFRRLAHRKVAAQAAQPAPA